MIRRFASISSVLSVLIHVAVPVRQRASKQTNQEKEKNKKRKEKAEVRQSKQSVYRFH